MMIPFRNHFLLFISILLASLPSLAQENFRAVHWGVAENMSVYPAYGMIKDVNGFMWIGTREGGLVRFDGSLFKIYRHENNTSNSILGNNIWGLIEDSLHNIWIGTENGLCLYDIEADSFRTVAALATKGFYNNSVVPFWATKDEIYCWNYPDSQWTAFNIHTLIKRPLAKITPDDIGHGISDRNSIYDAGSNSIWIEYGPGGTPGGGLLQVSLSTGKKIPFTWNCYRNIPNDDHSFEGMHYDRRRNAIWISCTDGLVEFTIDDKQFHHIAAMDSLVQLKDYHLWAGINIDTLGRIWMATFPKGIIIYDPSSESLRLPFPEDSILQQKISADNVMIYCDRDGMVWSGSWNTQQDGIYQLIPYSPPVKQFISNPGKSNSLSGDFIVFCLNAGRGKVWIGTGDGLNIFDTETGFFQILRKNDLPGLKGDVHEIQPTSVDTTTQKAWVSTDGGRYYQLDMRSKQCIPIIFKDSNDRHLIDQGGFSRPYKNGSVIGVDEGNRTLVFIGNSDSTEARQILSFPIGITSPFSIWPGDDQFLFVGRGDSTTINLSYQLLHDKWVRIYTPLDSIPWTNIIFNKADQTYWVNEENDLLHLSRDFRLIQTYSQKDGLPDGKRGCVIPDNYSNIWFTTDRSIYRLNFKTGKISVLSEREGFQANGFFPGLMNVKSTDGELFLPSGAYGKGFTRISPAKYKTTPSTVYIQSLLVNQHPYHFSPGIKNEPEISLRYFENRLTMEPGIIDFISAGKNKFRYKLGESAAWIYPFNNIIYYDNLAPGNYALIMQASNTEEFSGPATTLHIHISPPWWQTLWAYTLFAIAFASLLWSFIQYRSRALRAKNIQLEEKVLHRTKELKHSLEDLRETQNQLIQREKMASLGELTAGIAHEIQNPLNFVNNFSDLNAELLEEMKTKIKEGNPDEAIAIADDVIANEQKINHHGNRADAIVKGMLQHSGTSAGQKELTDINALAEEYLRLSYQGLRAKDKSFNAVLQTYFDPGVGKINIVPQDIGRVLLNLYNNAFYAINEKKKQQPEGYQPTVSVSTEKIESKVEIRLKDNGNGIPQKILDKIFQPFFTTKPTGKGTGLGLSLSYDIIKAHGGEIRVNTREGEGAEFIIQLPA
jgi:signal transduction histidine kinase/ligand-binding sensor domain-containing protein